VKVALVLVLAACSRQQATTSRGGPELFETYCTRCHGPKGKPDATMVATLNVRDLTAPEMRAKITWELVENQVRTGSKNKLMPSFQGLMSDEEIHALAVYVASPEFLKRK
jgi:mono/diheme cytochrome c family protein